MSFVDAKTGLYGVFGDPVGHSLSPVLHNWFMRRFGINGVYMAFAISADRLQKAIQALPTLGFVGVNITIPHKEAVLAYVNHCDLQAEIIGAANTIRIVDNRVDAYVTDADGFVLSLHKQQQRFHNASVVMLGAGGAARSIAYALARLQVARLAIINRTYSRAESLARFVRERFQLPDTKALPEGEQLEGLSSADIVINTTSVGMYPYTSESLVKDPRVFHNGQLVYDLIYNPSATRLLHDARRNGAEIQNGLDMLIYQGLVSLNIWRQDTYELRAADLQELRQVLTQELAAHE
ncbi:MAG TPA: shikimate dehydrogenase [bacterium]|nr:shikimate dehydrogenase [bacterium]